MVRSNDCSLLGNDYVDGNAIQVRKTPQEVQILLNGLFRSNWTDEQLHRTDRRNKRSISAGLYPIVNKQRCSLTNLLTAVEIGNKHGSIDQQERIFCYGG